ncbi:MAG TPA: HAD family hydrolase [Xanthobacteraceae bacterium]|jgi:D-glycero-D-manno-heptose 1,7-bisphosphate phosphatase
MTFPAGRPRPAAFLDRDGVLNVDIAYLHRPQDFCWVEGAIDAVKTLNIAGYLVIVATNQSGVARGFYDEAAVEALHAWMNDDLSRHGAHIDAFYYCPHHPQGTVAHYSRVCSSRKPGPGMLLRAMRDLPVRKEGSFSVGDKDSDMEAARRADVPAYLFTGGDLLAFVRQILDELATPAASESPPFAH